MRPDELPVLEILAPALFVVGMVYLIGPTLPLERRWARAAIFILVWVVIVRYLNWRIFTTLLPADGAWYEIGWVWFFFAVEIFALADGFVFYLTMLRTSDRRAEADRHEARLRALPSDQLPSVDVYIPTYNEPLDVLEKSITGARCLDYPNFEVWILDDGRRPWLKEYCGENGVGYLTRPDNTHAKAGNINHALTKTKADFVAVFDADFVPQRNFLMRTMGFFVDPKLGIVQVPHAFYNYDPMQTNLSLRMSLPDDQRFFFDSIMPSRDAWDAAFCCGSNSVTRRAALKTIGDALPTGSVTEDMLLTLTLLRQGYVTRYLCEHLAFGLAPESLKAFFIQRRRWVRGAMQILYLATGPLGRDLTFMQRLLFLPSHWLAQGLMFLVMLIAPILYMWTGLLPLVNVTMASIAYYQLPMLLAVLGGIWLYAPRYYIPFVAIVHGTFQAFKIVPAVLVALARPFGKVLFHVTPKGSAARIHGYEGAIFWTAAVLMALTIGGMLINAMPEWRVVIIPTGLLTTVVIWATLNVTILFIVCMMALQAPAVRAEERFDIDEPVWIAAPDGTRTSARMKNASLSGAGIVVDPAEILRVRAEEPLRIFMTEVGFIPGTVIRVSGRFIGIKFDLPPSIERDLLIRKLFTGGHNTQRIPPAGGATWAVLKSAWSLGSTRSPVQVNAPAVSPEEKLPPQSLIVPPSGHPVPLDEIAAQRHFSPDTGVQG